MFAYSVLRGFLRAVDLPSPAVSCQAPLLMYDAQGISIKNV